MSVVVTTDATPRMAVTVAPDSGSPPKVTRSLCSAAESVIAGRAPLQVRCKPRQREPKPQYKATTVAVKCVMSASDADSPSFPVASPVPGTSPGRPPKLATWLLAHCGIAVRVRAQPGALTQPFDVNVNRAPSRAISRPPPRKPGINVVPISIRGSAAASSMEQPASRSHHLPYFCAQYPNRQERMLRSRHTEPQVMVSEPWLSAKARPTTKAALIATNPCHECICLLLVENSKYCGLRSRAAPPRAERHSGTPFRRMAASDHRESASLCRVSCHFAHSVATCLGRATCRLYPRV
jgi:hypothetical protein